MLQARFCKTANGVSTGRTNPVAVIDEIDADGTQHHRPTGTPDALCPKKPDSY
jgi:hypothetical protein